MLGRRMLARSPGARTQGAPAMELLLGTFMAAAGRITPATDIATHHEGSGATTAMMPTVRAYTAAHLPLKVVAGMRGTTMGGPGRGFHRPPGNFIEGVAYPYNWYNGGVIVVSAAG